jgi:hypothetical protein
MCFSGVNKNEKVNCVLSKDRADRNHADKKTEFFEFAKRRGINF